jgi:hypothetical protein
MEIDVDINEICPGSLLNYNHHPEHSGRAYLDLEIVGR